jgi:hypothetical protein
MPKFTIETTYSLPIFRQRCYEAETLEAACRLAIEDQDWSDHKEDYETSGEDLCHRRLDRGRSGLQRPRTCDSRTLR